MKIKLNTIKSILKFIIAIILIGLAIYFLYKIITDNLIEGFDPTDCNDCKMNPSRGDCIEVYDFSFATTNYGVDANDLPEALGKFDISNYLFCPWESNCYNKESNLCCSGSQFYTNTTHFYNELSISEDVSTNCNKLNTVLNDLS